MEKDCAFRYKLFSPIADHWLYQRMCWMFIKIVYLHQFCVTVSIIFFNLSSFFPLHIRPCVYVCACFFNFKLDVWRESEKKKMMEISKFFTRRWFLAQHQIELVQPVLGDCCCCQRKTMQLRACCFCVSLWFKSNYKHNSNCIP